MERIVTADLGPGIAGWAAQVDGDIVCVATPRARHDPAARRQVRALVQSVGGDCASCGGCFIGRDVA